MAEGILTALQAALAGLGGGIEGAQQYRELERKRSMEQSELALRKRGLLAQMNATPIDDILPEEQGKVGPLAQGPSATPAPSAPPSTMMQAVMQQVRPPAGTGAPMAPPAFGTATETARPVSNVQRVMEDFRSRPLRTFREEGQRYALPRTEDERAMLGIALQQAMGQDTKAGDEAGIEKQAQLFASLVGGDMNKGRLLARGAPPGLVGVETATPLEKRVSEANIRQSDAAAAASRAAATLSREGGKQRTQEQIMDTIATGIARYATTRDERTGQLPDNEQVKVFGSMLRSLTGVPIPLEDEFTSAADKDFITTARKNGYSDVQIRQQLSKK